MSSFSTDLTIRALCTFHAVISRSESRGPAGLHATYKELNQTIQFRVRAVHMIGHTDPRWHWTASQKQLAIRITVAGTQYCKRSKMTVGIHKADLLHCNSVRCGRWTRQTPAHSALLHHIRLQIYSSYVIYLFIYGIFNDAISIASNGWTMRQSGKGVQRNERDKMPRTVTPLVCDTA